MNIKKLLVLISALVVVVAFVGCASQQEVANSDNVIKIGASPVPHAEILEEIKRCSIILMDKLGYLYPGWQ